MDYVQHSGVIGQKWGIRRYQNKDGSLTEAGKAHYYKQSATKRENAKRWAGVGASSAAAAAIAYMKPSNLSKGAAVLSGMTSVLSMSVSAIDLHSAKRAEAILKKYGNVKVN